MEAQQPQLAQQLMLAVQQHFVELIESSDYPNELLDMWREREDTAAHAAAATKEGPATRQNGAWRKVAARFFWSCGERLGDGCSQWFRELPLDQQQALWPMCFRATTTAVDQHTLRSMWFQAMALMDAVCDHMPARQAVAFLPRACVAIASLVYKAEVQADAPSPVAVERMVDSLAQDFEAEGGMAPLQISDEERDIADNTTLVAMEQDVLRLLQWRIQIPTIEFWLQAFAWRFDTATKQCFQAGVIEALEIGLMLAFQSEGLVSSRARDPEALARSIFCNGLLAAGALPWGHPVGCACALALETATGKSLAELMQDTEP